MEAAAVTGPAQGTDRIDRGTVMALVAMASRVFVIANDFTALSVALPAIEQDFDADVSTVQWVINAYALVFGVLIVTGGRLADMFGRRRIFFIGAAIFAGFSLLGGVAPRHAAWLIACRVADGDRRGADVAGDPRHDLRALPDAKAGLAGGLILGAAGIGNAVGPLIGGVLTDALSWRWIFFLNLPIAALRRARDLAADPRSAAERRRAADRLRRRGHPLGRPGLAAARARPGRPTGAGATRASSACSWPAGCCSWPSPLIERRAGRARWSPPT